METQTQEVQQSSTPQSEGPVQPSVDTVSDKPAQTITEKISSLKKEPGDLPSTQAAPPVPTDAPPAYSPNYKFKSFDKEYEMDEFVRGAIKDKDSEAKLRSIYEKAYGLDVIKPRYQETRQEYQKLKGDHETLVGNIGILEGFLNQGNFDEFFKTLNISDQAIYQYVLDKLNYQELPRDQQQRMDQFRKSQRDALMLDKQNQDLYSRFEQTQVDLRTLQLDSVMSRPDIKSIVDAYDSRRGTPGAFRERVIMEGQAVFNATGSDLAAEEAVKRVVELLDLQSAQQPPVNQAPTVAPQQAPTKPPVIPNIESKGTSPALKKPKSLKDLEQIREALG